MTRIVEIDYWKLIPDSKEHTEELIRNFAKFASKELEAVFNFGVVLDGEHLDDAAFFFMWFSRADYEKWDKECDLSKEFQDWLTIVEDGGLKHKMVDCDVIDIVH